MATSTGFPMEISTVANMGNETANAKTTTMIVLTTIGRTALDTILGTNRAMTVSKHMIHTNPTLGLKI